MSIKWMTEVWQHSKEDGTKLLMLLALADFANDTGWSWPSVNTLARKARIQERQAKRILHELVKDGELEIRVRGGPHRTNLYKLKVSPATPCHADHLIGGVDDTLGVVYTPPDPSLTINEPSIDRVEEKQEEKPTKRPTKQWLTNYEALLGYRIPNNGQEASGAAKLIDAGYTWEQVEACYKHIKADPFWQDKHVSLMKVNKEIGAWLKKHQREPKDYTGGFEAPKSSKWDTFQDL